MSRRVCSRGKTEKEAIEIDAPEHVRTAPAASSRDREPSVEDGFADAVGRLVPAVHGGLAGREELTLGHALRDRADGGSLTLRGPRHDPPRRATPSSHARRGALGGGAAGGGPCVWAGWEPGGRPRGSARVRAP